MWPSVTGANVSLLRRASGWRPLSPPIAADAFRLAPAARPDTLPRVFTFAQRGRSRSEMLLLDQALTGSADLHHLWRRLAPSKKSGTPLQDGLSSQGWTENVIRISKSLKRGLRLSGLSPRLPAQLSRLNASRRARAKRTRASRRRDRHRGGFPGGNGLHYDLDTGHCALDFALHALNLRLEKALQLLKLGRKPFKSVDRA